MSKLKLATTSVDLKIWDLPDYLLTYQKSLTTPTPIADLHWSSDGLALLTLPASGDKYYMTIVNNHSSYETPQFTSDLEITTACFANLTNKFLGFGTKAGKVIYFNQRTKRAEKLFLSHCGKVNCVRFNGDDRYIASASEDGYIHLHNIVSGLKVGTLNLIKEGAVQKIEYSRIKRSLLGAASISGTLSLWDANILKCIHKFDVVHSAPVSDLTFSPTNMHLLFSVGLDKKLKIYDANVKAVVKTYVCDEPLTSIDMLNDGVTIAVGSSQGKVYLYDNRNYKTPFKSIDAHTSSILGVSFRNNANESVSDMKKYDYSIEMTRTSPDNLEASFEYEVFSPINSNKDILQDSENRSRYRRSNLYDSLPHLASVQESLKDDSTSQSPLGFNNLKQSPHKKSNTSINSESPSSLTALGFSPYVSSTENSLFSAFDANHSSTARTNILISGLDKPESYYQSPDQNLNSRLNPANVNNDTLLDGPSSSVKQYINDKLEETQEKLEKRIFNIHTQMVRGFVNQRNQVDLLASLLKKEKDLVDRIEELEIENQRLKGTYSE